jgi:hypothetical protein
MPGIRGMSTQDYGDEGNISFAGVRFVKKDQREDHCPDWYCRANNLVKLERVRYVNHVLEQSLGLVIYLILRYSLYIEC